MASPRRLLRWACDAENRGDHSSAHRLMSRRRYTPRLDVDSRLECPPFELSNNLPRGCHPRAGNFLVDYQTTGTEMLDGWKSYADRKRKHYGSRQMEPHVPEAFEA